MFSNPDALWIFIYVFYSVAALGAIFAAVTLTTVIRESRREATQRRSVLTEPERAATAEPARQAA